MKFRTIEDIYNNKFEIDLEKITHVRKYEEYGEEKFELGILSISITVSKQEYEKIINELTLSQTEENKTPLKKTIKNIVYNANYLDDHAKVLLLQQLDTIL